ncbi:hypothetical protein SBV1_1910020 [Verrucomicrobia bacterium]|nr:hypothetical protein SBV1_1910020 [Verrucomicrobiota bacterium]
MPITRTGDRLKWLENPEIRELLGLGVLPQGDKVELVRKQMFGDIDDLVKQRHVGPPEDSPEPPAPKPAGPASPPAQPA